MDNVDEAITTIVTRYYPQTAEKYLSKGYVSSLPKYLGEGESVEAVLFGQTSIIIGLIPCGLWATNRRLIFLPQRMITEAATDYSYEKIQTVTFIPGWPHVVDIRTTGFGMLNIQLVDVEVARKFVSIVRFIIDSRQKPTSGLNFRSSDGTDMVSQLKELARLREIGVIDENEFISAKKKLIEKG